MECDELWNIKGITLCKQCHLLKHHNGIQKTTHSRILQLQT